MSGFWLGLFIGAAGTLLIVFIFDELVIYPLIRRKLHELREKEEK